MKTAITLTAIFTASIMMNVFTFFPECFGRVQRPVMTAENLISPSVLKRNSDLAEKVAADTSGQFNAMIKQELTRHIQAVR